MPTALEVGHADTPHQVINRLSSMYPRQREQAARALNRDTGNRAFVRALRSAPTSRRVLGRQPLPAATVDDDELIAKLDRESALISKEASARFAGDSELRKIEAGGKQLA